MSMYKIGEVARLLGLPNDTLRYYEKRGLISPQKDESSGYRYYDAWDLNFLLDSKWYRSFDFSLSDVEQMLHSDELEEYLMRCHKHEAELLRIINSYQQKLKALVLFYQRIERAQRMLGHVEVVESPAMVFQKHRQVNKFVDNDEGLSVVQKWANLMPFVDHTFMVARSERGSNEPFDTYYWGFSLPPKAALRYGIDIEPPVEHIPSQKSVHVFSCAKGRDTFLDCYNEQVIDVVQGRGYKIIEKPVGHLVARLKIDGEFTRLFESWVPIE